MASFDKSIFSTRAYFSNAMAQYRNRADLQSFLELILSLTTIIIFAVFALRPTLITIATLLQEIQTKRDTLAKIESKLQNLSEAQTIYEREQRSISLLTNAITYEYKPDILVRQIEGFSQKNGVTIEALSVDEGTLTTQQLPVNYKDYDITKPYPIEKTDFSITSSVEQSDYVKINSFLKDLNNALVPLDITNITITSQSSQSNNQILAVIQGKFLYVNTEREVSQTN